MGGKRGSRGSLSIGSSCGGGLLLCYQTDITWPPVGGGKSLWNMRSARRTVDREHLIVLCKGIRRHYEILSLLFCLADQPARIAARAPLVEPYDLASAPAEE
jgi:hypothetical protein